MFQSVLGFFQSKQKKADLINCVLVYHDNSVDPSAHRDKPFYSRKTKSQLSKLRIPTIKSMNLRWAEKLVTEGTSPVLADNCVISPSSTYRSRTGRNVTIAFGRDLPNTSQSILIAYPEERDLKTFALASQEVSLCNGPGDQFPGSVGVLRFSVNADTTEVLFLQSSVAFTEAFVTFSLSAEYKRAYSSWPVCLLDNLFTHSAQIGSKSIILPENKIIKSIGEKKLAQIAAKHSFEFVQKESDLIKEDLIKLRFQKSLK